MASVKFTNQKGTKEITKEEFCEIMLKKREIIKKNNRKKKASGILSQMLL